MLESGVNCDPIQQCSPNSYSCSICTGNDAAVTCVCNPGFRINGTECVNVDECEEGTHNCLLSEECVDKEGYFLCLNINECESQTHNCSKNANCIDTSGSYYCLCHYGYQGNGFNCSNINECHSDDYYRYYYSYNNYYIRQCPEESSCIDTIGSYECVCNSGYTQNFSQYRDLRNQNIDMNFCQNINECETGEHNCSQYSDHAECRDTIGSFECVCQTGFEGNGFACNNINECERYRYLCPSYSVCVDTIGSYDCKCRSGYSGNGSFCENIDECAMQVHNCSENANCTDTRGSYDCICHQGYEGNGFNCSNIDECYYDNYYRYYYSYKNYYIRECPEGSSCIDTVGSYECVCNSGYTQNFTFSQYMDLRNQNSNLSFCNNVDECETGEHNCTEYSDHAECRDTIGSFECVCQTGFEGNGFVCNNNNECERSSYQCPSYSVCVDTIGSYDCKCRSGYSGNGSFCENIDECEIGQHNCSQNASCIDTVGSYDCTCKFGFEGNGFVCNNINECEVYYIYYNNQYYYIPECPQGSSCVDNFGSFECVCDPGYSGNGTFCENINECETGEHNCTEYSDSAECRDTVGSFKCDCQTGFERNGFECNNIDECQSDYYYDNNYNYLRRCPYNSVCVDTPGSYDCVCNSGFTGDSSFCQDIDECQGELLSNCSENANCLNTYGSYDCSCRVGFEGNGFVCTKVTCQDCPDYSECVNDLCTCRPGFFEFGDGCLNIDECKAGTHSCSQFASCTDLFGSYSCKCNRGYFGNGIQCDPVLTCQAGSYLSAEGVCLQCPSNSFSSISRNTLRKCVPCPRGWITNGPGKTSASECRSKYNYAFGI